MTFFFTYLFMVLVFWRPQDWLFPALYGWPLLDVIFYVALLSMLLEIDQGRIRSPRRIPQISLLAGLWVAAVFSHVPHTYFQGILDTSPPVFKLCVFTALFLCVLDRPGRLRATAVAIVAMACVMAVHALLQERRGYGFAGARPYFVPAIKDKPAHTRALFFGIFEDPNDLAQNLAMAIPFAFMLLRRRSLLGTAAGTALTVLFYRAIEATHSRGGVVALVSVFSVMLVLRLPPRVVPSAIAVLAVGGLAACPFSVGFLDPSAHDRVVFWGMANQHFKQNPIFGIGYGMFWQIAKDMAAHNAFVHCYTEVGFVGYWFWLQLPSLALLGSWRSLSALVGVNDPDAQYVRRFAGAGIAAMIGFLTSGYFLSRSFVYPLFFLSAILGAVPWVAERYLPEDAPPLIEPGRDVGRYGTVASFVSIVYIYVSILLLNKAFYG